MDMKRKFWRLFPYSIIAGLVITLLLMGQMRWDNYQGCVQYNASYVNIRRVSCASMEYGYPLKFAKAGTFIQVSSLSPDKGSQKFVDESAIIRYRPWNFIADTAIWSAVSLALLMLIASRYRPRRRPAK